MSAPVSGDTLGSIAVRFNESLSDLVAANPQVTDIELINEGDILNVPSLAVCGGEPYEMSNYTCFDNILCPVIEGVPTLLCGKDCYLPPWYLCDTKQIVQPASAAVVIGGTTFVLGANNLTITANGTLWILRPSEIVEGSKTVHLPTAISRPIIISTEGTFFTIEPGPFPGHSVAPTLASSTLAPAQPAVTVETLTALTGRSTTVVTFTPITLSQFSTVTALTTLATIRNGVSISLVVGPGGIVWDCGNCSTNSIFPPLTFPALPPPAQTSGPIPVLTSSASFPSEVFPLPPFITTIVTESGGGGVIVVTRTKTLNPDSVLVPVHTLQSGAASESVSDLASEFHALSSIVSSFSADPKNPAASSSALAAIQNARSHSNDFGTELAVAVAGLCFIFCSLMTSAASILSTLEEAVVAGGPALPGLAALVAGLGATADALLSEAEDPSSTAASSSSTSSSTSSSACTSTCSACDFIIPGVDGPEVDDGNLKRAITGVAGRISWSPDSGNSHPWKRTWTPNPVNGIFGCQYWFPMALPPYPQAFEVTATPRLAQGWYITSKMGCVLTYRKADVADVTSGLVTRFANTPQSVTIDFRGNSRDGFPRTYRFGGEIAPSLNMDHVYELSFLKDFLKWTIDRGVQCRAFNEFFMFRNWLWPLDSQWPLDLSQWPDPTRSLYPRLQALYMELPSLANPDFAGMDHEINHIKGVLCNVRLWGIEALDGEALGSWQKLALLQKIAVALAYTQDDDVRPLFEKPNKRIYQAFLGFDSLIAKLSAEACPATPAPALQATWARDYAGWMDNHIATNQASIGTFVLSVINVHLPDQVRYNTVTGEPGVLNFNSPNAFGNAFNAFMLKYPAEHFTFGFRTGAWGGYRDFTPVIGRRDEPTPTACPRPVTASQTPTTTSLPTSTTVSQAPTMASPTLPVQTCSPPRGCELDGCSGIFTAGVGRCQGAHQGCECEPSHLTPGFCSQQLSCDACTGTYDPNSNTAHCQGGPFQGCTCIPTLVTCGTRQNCDANGCGGTFDDSSNVARCRGNFKGCQCNAGPSSCGAPQSCDGNGCAGTFDPNSSQAYCRVNFAGCQCIPSPITCGVPQSCSSNGCEGTFEPNSNTAVCRANFPTCECIPDLATCGQALNCDLNGCSGTYDGNSNLAICTGNFRNCFCNPVESTCGSPQSCDNNGCDGTFDSSGVATCQGNFRGCKCLPTQATCGTPQSCDNNGCNGGWDPQGIARCNGNFLGCPCLPTARTCGQETFCDLNGCNGGLDQRTGRTTCRGTFFGCSCTLRGPQPSGGLNIPVTFPANNAPRPPCITAHIYLNDCLISGDTLEAQVYEDGVKVCAGGKTLAFATDLSTFCIGGCQAGYSFCVTHNTNTATYTNGNGYVVTMQGAARSHTFACAQTDRLKFKGIEFENCVTNNVPQCAFAPRCELCDFRTRCN